MKPGFYLAIALAIIGIILFIAGSSIIGKYVYDIRLMLTLAVFGVILIVAAMGVGMLALLRK